MISGGMLVIVAGYRAEEAGSRVQPSNLKKYYCSEMKNILTFQQSKSVVNLYHVINAIDLYGLSVVNSSLAHVGTGCIRLTYKPYSHF